jgi:DNA-binding MurR/RpiR family transcriptional regulator
MDAALAAEDSLIIGISVSGETKEVIDAVKMAKQQGVLAITSEKTSKLAQLADLILMIISKVFVGIPFYSIKKDRSRNLSLI